MGFKSTILTLLPLFIANAYAADVFYTINVTNAVVAPDGTPRSSIIAGQFGGVPLVANKGDTLHINVTNSLFDPTMRRSTSIHWHGLFQDRTASEDGPSFVNQCPIGPGHFYHDPDDPQKNLWDVDDASTIITLADWYHAPAEQLMAQFKLDGHEPVPGSGLINGVGRFKGGPQVTWAVVNVQQGKRYRFRVINMAAFAAFTFSIDGHTFDVIETDGIATAPLTVSSFEIYVAQRYSFVLNANQPVNNYWINAPMTVQGSSAILDKQNVKAILRYAGAPNSDPTTSGAGSSSAAPLQEFQLQTLINPGAPGGSAPADRTIDLDFDAAGNGLWEINGVSYVPPDLPTLLKIINGATTPSDFNVTENTFVLERNQVVELRIHGADHGITHPFHLHGHAFDVVQSASGPTNYVNPPRRDVIGVDQGGVIIRFRTDNPGPWFLHCHIDWHLEAGLAVVFAEAPADQRAGPQSQIIPAAWNNLCPIYNNLTQELQ
ncbi:Multicopper oxidase [Mycena sanguinolenta]|uniref:Multicopper oxidase n=1 Tax=Mycena sanguinolenta TaxID=230812 RepID=A0A8H7CMV4_9AGAR|nr:Multicopper oxidase [Mycena sanguinolenta]